MIPSFLCRHTSRRISPTVSLLSLFLAATLPLAAAWEEEVVLSENFASSKWTADEGLSAKAKNGWSGNDDSDAALQSRIAASTGSAEPQSLYLCDNSPTGTALAKYDLGKIVNKGYIEFSVKIPGKSGIYLRGCGSSVKDVNFLLALSSKISIYQKSSALLKSVTPKEVGYNPSRWTTFRITFDDERKSASVSIDGVPIAGLAIASGECDAVSWQVRHIQLVVGHADGTNISANFGNVKVVQTAH